MGTNEKGSGMDRLSSRRSLMFSALATLALAPMRAGAETLPYRLRPEDAEIGFTFTVGDVAVKGRAPLRSADILVDTTDLTRSTANVTADVTRARTGMIIATQTLKSADILDADRFPTAQFSSTRVRLGSNGRISEGARISGNLTLRGVTRPIQLNAALSRPAGTAPDDLRRLSIQLTGSLSRRDFGIVAYPDLVKDAVRLDIRAGLRAA